MLQQYFTNKIIEIARLAIIQKLPELEKDLAAKIDELDIPLFEGDREKTIQAAIKAGLAQFEDWLEALLKGGETVG
jgi:hypothetical protein